MAPRVPKAELTLEPSAGMIEQLGAVPEAGEVMRHHPEVAGTVLESGAEVGAWDVADASLQGFSAAYEMTPATRPGTRDEVTTA